MQKQLGSSFVTICFSSRIDVLKLPDGVMDAMLHLFPRQQVWGQVY